MTVSGAPTATRPRSGSSDILAAVAAFESWLSLGAFDIRQRYRRSAIGPFWIVISTAAVAGGIGFMMSSIQGRPITNLLAYIIVGIMIWQFLSTALAESCQALIGRAAYIKSLPQPICANILRTLWVQVLIFLHTMILYPFVVLLTGIPMSANLLMAIPGLALLILNLGWMSVILATVSARFRDIPLVVGNFLSFLMFLTPVFWEPNSSNPHYLAAIDYNPLYWLIQLVREPMLGNMPVMLQWVGSMVMAVLGWVVAGLIYNRAYKRLALWV
ncbi:ABC transporter permease [Mesorhizobium sp. B2-5-4]|uniref:ABC transporter permease n=1 Tax=Mesorhizobium sp. B2-5-4 TaxID=2589926 RepID=UPI001127FB59|nr:ABC transporter permease [Mesorhizobium sp. B2-5-4]TPK35966.1 ABC transporter permease [Mesorhizobium sp. B2-5-4]